jgi:hypothetical protein
MTQKDSQTLLTAELNRMIVRNALPPFRLVTSTPLRRRCQREESEELPITSQQSPNWQTSIGLNRLVAGRSRSYYNGNNLDKVMICTEFQSLVSWSESSPSWQQTEVRTARIGDNGWLRESGLAGGLTCTVNLGRSTGFESPVGSLIFDSKAVTWRRPRGRLGSRDSEGSASEIVSAMNSGLNS